MALIDCEFFSDVLGLSTSMRVILPQKTQRQIGMTGYGGNQKCPTLWLLHGLSDDHTIWSRRTAIERYVAPTGLAVVMPTTYRGWYTDMHAGLNYWTFMTEELPQIARSFFPLSDRREDNFVAGLSMGGYGAFKMALRRPDCFEAAISLSGGLDMAGRVILEKRITLLDEFQRVFGPVDQLAGSPNDLIHLAEQLAKSDQPRPRLFQWCGTEDFLYPCNLKFRDHARLLGLDLHYSEGTGGHTWDCWDREIRRAIQWLGFSPGQ